MSTIVTLVCRWCAVLTEYLPGADAATSLGALRSAAVASLVTLHFFAPILARHWVRGHLGCFGAWFRRCSQVQPQRGQV